MLTLNRLTTYFTRALEWVGHWLPHHHFAAAAGLAVALLLVMMIPDSTDAYASKTIINISTGETYTQALQPDSTSPSPAPPEKISIIPSADPAKELEEVLALSSFAMNSVKPEAHNIDLTSAFEYEEKSPLSQAESNLDNRLILEVQSGDNLSLLFQRAGLSDRDVHLVSSGDEPEKKILTRLYPGYQLAFDIKEDTLNSLEVITQPLESYHYVLNDNSRYDANHEVRAPDVRQTFKQATIQGSLFQAAQQVGIPASLTIELAGIYGGVIDFMLDTRSGDTFTLLYEEKYLNGEYIGTGQILAAEFTNQGETHTALRYVNSNGDVDFYNPQGESMRKAFLRNPVDFVRISSNFNPNRRHPILNTIRAHKGTDYAAPTGTPVVATSDGKVTWASVNGSFGKLVVVKHNGRFETKYAHLNAYANGVKVGSRVKQGQIIGYVGSTGGATGPHLHYEFLMDGVHRNARTIHNQLPKAESIASNEMSRFHDQTREVIASLDTLPSTTTLALLDTQNPQ